MPTDKLDQSSSSFPRGIEPTNQWHEFHTTQQSRTMNDTHTHTYGGRRHIISQAWGKHVNREGFPYYYNPFLQRAIWTLPYDLIEQRYGHKTKERAVRTEHLSRDKSNPWRVAYNRAGQRFYSNIETKVSSWKMPDEIIALVKEYDELLSQFSSKKSWKSDDTSNREESGALLRSPDKMGVADEQTVLNSKTRPVANVTSSHPESPLQLPAVISQKRATEDEQSLQAKKLKGPPYETREQQPASGNTGEISDGICIDNIEFSIDPEDYLLSEGDNESSDSDVQKLAQEHAVKEGEEEKETPDDLMVSLDPSDYIEQESAPVAVDLPVTAEVVGNIDEELISHEECCRLLKVAFKHHSVNPLSTWEKERHHIPKNTMELLSEEDAREIFNVYCRERIAEMKATRKISTPQDAFKEMLQELSLSPSSVFLDVARLKSRDERYRRLDQKMREKLFKEFMVQMQDGSLSIDERPIKETPERPIMDPTKMSSMHDGDDSFSGRQDDETQRRLDKAERERAKGIFKVIVGEHLKHPEMAWRDMEKILNGDTRYRAIKKWMSEKEEKYLFEEMLDDLYHRRRRVFYELIEECILLKGEHMLLCNWEDIAKLVKSHEKSLAFSHDVSRLERYFKGYMKDRKERAIEEFKCLLKENAYLVYHAGQKMQMKEVYGVIGNDVRCQRLNFMKDERDQIVLQYLEGFVPDK